jgi:tricorn protease
VVEAHGDIMSVPAKDGVLRNITSTPGVMEREPAWSPDGQSIAYFSDEDGRYALHVGPQTGAGASTRKYALASEPAFYFKPSWSPDSKKIAFRDNRLFTWLLDLTSGRLAKLGEDAFGGFVAEPAGMAWSPDSRLFAFARMASNHAHVLMLHDTAAGRTTQVTDEMARAASPAFDADGKYLYFLASNNAGATAHRLDMSSNLYRPTSSVYALSLARATPSPVAPENKDEKVGGGGDEPGAATSADANKGKATKKAAPTSAVDLAGLSPDAIVRRIAALPLPEWGAMLSDGRAFFLNAWWLSAFPGVAIFLTVLLFNAIGRRLHLALPA